MNQINHQGRKKVADRITALDIYEIADYANGMGIERPLEHVSRVQARAILTSMRIMADIPRPNPDIEYQARRQALIHLVLPSDQTSTLLPAEAIATLARRGEYRPDLQLPTPVGVELAENVVALATYGTGHKLYQATPSTVLRQAIRRMDAVLGLATRSREVQDIYHHWLHENRGLLLRAYRLSPTRRYNQDPVGRELKLVSARLRDDLSRIMTTN